MKGRIGIERRLYESYGYHDGASMDKKMEHGTETGRKLHLKQRISSLHHGLLKLQPRQQGTDPMRWR